MGSNVAVASPDMNRIERGSQSLDHLTVCDAFPNETTAHAHVVLPVYQWAEEEGTMTNLEGRVIRRRRAARPPSGVRGDIDVIRELADRLGCGEKFAFHSPRQCSMSSAGRRPAAPPTTRASPTSGSTARTGVFWPCPAETTPARRGCSRSGSTTRTAGHSFIAVEHRPAGDEPDADVPVLLHHRPVPGALQLGRQTRLVGVLRKAKPRPVLQLHPTAARRHAR